MFKFALLGLIGLGFWGGSFAISLRVLRYFRGIEEIGNILAYKLLSMILITSFALLIFSSLLTTLSKLYLSKDLFLVHSMPVSAHKIFIARWIDSTIESSWMVIIYTLPILISYGIVYSAGPFYYASIILTFMALSIIASAISSILIVTAVIVIPANRMKSVFIFLGILLFVVLYLAIRLVRPEQLVDPEIFETVLFYMSALKTPSSPFLPSTWAFDSLKSALSGLTGQSLFHIALSCSGAGLLLFVNVLLADSV